MMVNVFIRPQNVEKCSKDTGLNTNDILILQLGLNMGPFLFKRIDEINLFIHH